MTRRLRRDHEQAGLACATHSAGRNSNRRTAPPPDGRLSRDPLSPGRTGRQAASPTAPGSLAARVPGLMPPERWNNSALPRICRIDRQHGSAAGRGHRHTYPRRPRFDESAERGRAPKSGAAPRTRTAECFTWNSAAHAPSEEVSMPTLGEAYRQIAPTHTAVTTSKQTTRAPAACAHASFSARQPRSRVSVPVHQGGTRPTPAMPSRILSTRRGAQYSRPSSTAVLCFT